MEVLEGYDDENDLIWKDMFGYFLWYIILSHMVSFNLSYLFLFLDKYWGISKKSKYRKNRKKIFEKIKKSKFFFDTWKKSKKIT